MLYETDTFGNLDLLVLSQLSHRPTDIWTRVIQRHSHLQTKTALNYFIITTGTQPNANATFCSSKNLK